MSLSHFFKIHFDVTIYTLNTVRKERVFIVSKPEAHKLKKILFPIVAYVKFLNHWYKIQYSYLNAPSCQKQLYF